MQKAAINRKAYIVEIKIRQMLAHAFTVQKDCIVALIHHRIAAPHERITLPVRVEQVNQPTLRVHNIVIKVFFQAFPKLQRMAVKL